MKTVVRTLSAASAATVLALVAGTPAIAADATYILDGKGTFTAVALRSTVPVSCANGSPGELTVKSHWRGEDVLFSGTGFEVESTAQQLDMNVRNSCTGVTTTVSGRTDNRGGGYSLTDNGKKATIQSQVDVWGDGVAEFASVEVNLGMDSTSRPVRKVKTEEFVTGTERTTVRTVTNTRAAKATGTVVVHGSGIPGLDEVELRAAAWKVQGSLGALTSRSTTRPIA
jgi:hypothetical protein